MKYQRSQLSLVGLLIVLAGCADQSVGHRSSDDVAIAPSPLATSSEEAVSQPFDELLTDTAVNPPRLIPELSSLPTSADQSLSLASGQSTLPSVSVVASRGRLPPVPPIPEVAPLSVPVPPAPTLTRIESVPNRARSVIPVPTRSPSAPVAATPARTTTTPARSPSPVAAARQPTQPQVVAVQPRPQAVPNRLAESVVVTGVVQVGDTVSAIVQIPNERSSRYVRAGDYLANGILVNRIEMTADGEPRVILVQNGVETVRTVGGQ